MAPSARGKGARGSEVEHRRIARSSNHRIFQAETVWKLKVAYLDSSVRFDCLCQLPKLCFLSTNARRDRQTDAIHHVFYVSHHVIFSLTHQD